VTGCVPAIDLTYGVVLCFACHDYVYCDEVDTIAQSQRQLTGTSLGTSAHWHFTRYAWHSTQMAEPRHYIFLVYMDYSMCSPPCDKLLLNTGVVICLEQVANYLHLVQLMPLAPHHLLLH